MEFVTSASWFGRQGVLPPYCPEKFSKFQPENTCFLFSKKSLESLNILILFSAGIYFFKDWLKCSQNENIFFSFSILKWHIIVQTNQKISYFSKMSILTNKAPLVLIFFRGTAYDLQNLL